MYKLAAVVTTIALVCAYLVKAQDHNSNAHAGPAMNYHEIDARLATSGHFTGGGLDKLTAEGVEVVIDLREQQPEGSAVELKRRGIKKIHLPVSWEDPQPEDFEEFARVMKEHRDRKVLVQCMANYRASAMTYLYRVIHEDAKEAGARADMEAVWEPNKTWRKYIKQAIAEAKN